MTRRKTFLAALILTILSITSALAQTPDTTTFKYSYSRRWHNAVVTLRDKTTRTGYMPYYMPYAPEKTVYLIPTGGTKKNTEKIKRDHIERLEYADVRYELVKPDLTNDEYLAQVVNQGKLTLYAFTEYKRAPVPIPVAGVVGVISIPYDQSTFFLKTATKLVKINKSLFREQLIPYIQDNTQLVEKLKNKEYKFKDIPAIIAAYNKAADQI